MESKIYSIVISSFLVFALIVTGIPTAFENVFAQQHVNSRYPNISSRIINNIISSTDELT